MLRPATFHFTPSFQEASRKTVAMFRFLADRKGSAWQLGSKCAKGVHEIGKKEDLIAFLQQARRVELGTAGGLRGQVQGKRRVVLRGIYIYIYRYMI